MSGQSHGSWLGPGQDRRRVEAWLGAALPEGAADLRFFRWQPSTDLALHDLFVRFRATREEYLEFIVRRGLLPRAEAVAAGLLPTHWRTSDEFDPLPWWDATGTTPEDAAAGQVGVHGRIFAKHENGHVYVMLMDTGHREP